MTAILCIALLLAIFGSPTIKGSTGVVIATIVSWVVLILGLATLALLSSGWAP